MKSFTTKDQVVTEYCKLSAMVANQKFKFTHSADCFCGENSVVDDPRWTYRYDENILKFIRDAVEEKLKHDPNL